MHPKLALQHLLPHRALGALVLRATRCTWPPLKNLLIDQVMRRYRVNLHEAQVSDAHAFEHFNAFFTRALKDGTRPMPEDPAAIACPADGRISQAGRIREGRIFQAKGQEFTCAELLADPVAAAPYREGSFATIYLSPRDYHRVHMPLEGRLLSSVHVPGRLFSVAPFAVAGIPRLFARNERLICHFEGATGPFAVVMVGAMLVSGIDCVWAGTVVPPHAHAVQRRDHADDTIELARGAEMARFNMGSTVIVLLPGPHAIDPALRAEQAVRVGQAIGHLAPAAT